MSARRDIITFSESPALTAELIAAARSLIPFIGGHVISIVLGPWLEAEKAIFAGADRVYWLGEMAGSVMVEDYTSTIAGILQTEKPYGFLLGATKRGKAIAGRLGARLSASAITDVRSFITEGKELQLTHKVFGGAAIRYETHASDIMLATVGLGTFEAAWPDTKRKGDIIEVEFVQPKWRLNLRERKPKPSSSVNLAAAKRVVCPGCGITKEEELALIEELAKVLSAEIGYTRKLAESIESLTHERDVGISGAYIKPDLYLGIGVSGQAQHTVGITDSKVVVAINKDKRAPIFAQADYGIVGDFHEVVPALIEALKTRHKKAALQ